MAVSPTPTPAAPSVPPPRSARPGRGILLTVAAFQQLGFLRQQHGTDFLL